MFYLLKFVTHWNFYIDVMMLSKNKEVVVVRRAGIFPVSICDMPTTNAKSKFHEIRTQTYG